MMFPSSSSAPASDSERQLEEQLAACVADLRARTDELEACRSQRDQLLVELQGGSSRYVCVAHLSGRQAAVNGPHSSLCRRGDDGNECIRENVTASLRRACMLVPCMSVPYSHVAG